MKPSILERRLKFKPPLKFFKFGLSPTTTFPWKVFDCNLTATCFHKTPIQWLNFTIFKERTFYLKNIKFMNLVYFYILYPKDPEISLYTDVCLLVVYSSVHNSTCCGKYQISLYTDVCLMVVYSSVHNSTCCGKYQISISGCYMIFECSQEF